MGKKLTTEEFINRSNIANKSKYSYENTVYKDIKTKVIITCPIHGDFLQSPGHHMNGTGCQKCSGCKKLTTEEFIDKSNKVHNFKYDYSKYNIAIEYNGIQHYTNIEYFNGGDGFMNIQKRDELKREKCRLNNCSLFELKYDYDQNDYNSLINNIKILTVNEI